MGEFNGAGLLYRVSGFSVLVTITQDSAKVVAMNYYLGFLTKPKNGKVDFNIRVVDMPSGI